MRVTGKGKKRLAKPTGVFAPRKGIYAPSKAPGQVGIHSQNSIDGVRRGRASHRSTNGSSPVAGVSNPRVCSQTYDCYNTRRKKR